MLLYVLIGLCLALAGVAGLQLMYMFYLDRIDRERKKRVVVLEKQCRALTRRLSETENQLAEQRRILVEVCPELDEDEVWADVIDDR